MRQPVVYSAELHDPIGDRWPALRVAAAQFTPRSTIDASVERMAAVLAHASLRGVDVVVFPEMSLTGYDLDRLQDDDVWLHPGHSVIERINDACTRHDVAAVISAPVRMDDDRGVLAALFIGQTGVITISPKQHLHGREHEYFTSADPAPPTPYLGWRLGLAVCLDAAFPDHARAAADAGANLYLVSAFYAAQQCGRLTAHMSARAATNQFHAVLANFSAHHRPVPCCGGSGIWRPDGTPIARAGNEDDLVVAELVHPTAYEADKSPFPAPGAHDAQHDIRRREVGSTSSVAHRDLPVGRRQDPPEFVP